jgi:hypothetical protein
VLGCAKSTEFKSFNVLGANELGWRFFNGYRLAATGETSPVKPKRVQKRKKIVDSESEVEYSSAKIREPVAGARRSTRFGGAENNDNEVEKAAGDGNDSSIEVEDALLLLGARNEGKFEDV